MRSDPRKYVHIHKYGSYFMNRFVFFYGYGSIVSTK